MHITFVKKILATGEPCRKCREVETRLDKSGHMDRIDRILIADEREPESPGAVLARELSVDRAPFFVVENEGVQTVYTVYFKFLKEVLEVDVSSADAAGEVLRDNPELDFI